MHTGLILLLACSIQQGTGGGREGGRAGPFALSYPLRISSLGCGAQLQSLLPLFSQVFMFASQWCIESFLLRSACFGATLLTPKHGTGTEGHLWFRVFPHILISLQPHGGVSSLSRPPFHPPFTLATSLNGAAYSTLTLVLTQGAGSLWKLPFVVPKGQPNTPSVDCSVPDSVTWKAARFYTTRACFWTSVF